MTSQLPPTAPSTLDVADAVSAQDDALTSLGDKCCTFWLLITAVDVVVVDGLSCSAGFEMLGLSLDKFSIDLSGVGRL